MAAKALLRQLICHVLVVVFGFGVLLSGVVSEYVRPPPRPTLSSVGPHDQHSTSPQQVHISVVGQDKMRVSWITDQSSPAIVQYGTSSGVYKNSANGTTSSYRYLVYKSGEIHDVDIGPLNPDTTYYYRCGPNSAQELSFKTPPAHLPIHFAVIGDLGQTEWTKTTLQHIANSNYDMLLLPGDLSYADTYQPLWDSFGRLVEPLASRRPWMVTQGNHEVEAIPILHSSEFTAYNARWHMPYEESGSKSNLYYSFDAAGGSVHVVMLGSYTDYEKNSDQYKWLEADLKKVDRGKTPWIVVIIHAPWYNSNTAHQGETESEGMRDAMEGLIHEARVDVVFAGHVHAYERFTRVFGEKANECGAVHITIGDGGNREGLAKKYKDPKPATSLFREASFGHGQLDVVNATHALWTWRRNDADEKAVASDSIWLNSLVSDPKCKT